MENCLSLAKSSELDIEQSIICKKKIKVSLTSAEKIIDAAIRKDEAYQQLQNGNINRNFKYQFLFKYKFTNSCFKNYAMKKNLNLSL